MNELTGHFHGWLPRFSAHIIYCQVFIWTSPSTKPTAAAAAAAKKPKWSVNGFSWLSNLFPLADPPACHLVGLMSEPSGLAELCSGGQVHCMCQLCLRLTDQCEKCCCLWSFVLFRFHLRIFSFKNMNNICLWWRNPWPIIMSIITETFNWTF